MNQSLANIKVIAFDAYGTLFDVASIDNRLKDHFGEKASQVAAVWRRKQLEYTWLRTLMNRYKNFYELTRDALLFALHDAQLEASKMIVEDLMENYNRLKVFPEVKGALAQLSGKYQLAILSNANLELLEAAANFNDITPYLSKILSVDTIQQFKPTPSVYQIPMNQFAVSPKQIAFVSSNTWDVAGAKSFGLSVVWAKRRNTALEQLGYEPDLIVNNLLELSEKLII